MMKRFMKSLKGSDSSEDSSDCEEKKKQKRKENKNKRPVLLQKPDSVIEGLVGQFSTVEVKVQN